MPAPRSFRRPDPSPHDAAVAAMYAAALGQTPWTGALDAMRIALGFEAATFYAHDRRATVFDPARPVVHRGVWQGLDPSGEAEYRAHFFRLDPRVAHTLAHPGTRLLYDHLYTSPADLRDGAYRSLYRRTTGMEYSLGGHVGVQQPFFGSIALHRRRSAGPSTRAEHAQFSVLFDHLERALNVEYRLHEGGQGLAALRNLADQNDNAVVFLDVTGRVLHANGRASALVARGDGLILGRTVSACRPTARTALQAAIGDAIAGRGAGPVRLPRASGALDYVAVTSPVASTAASGLFEISTVAACVIITDAEGQAPWSAAALQAALGLTAAEARLLSRLARGQSLAQISAEIRVSVNTLRTQLATTFQKTGTHRQSDLVRLVHALPRPAAE